MRKTQIAINSVSTRQYRIEEALDAYAEAGFRPIEFVLPQLKSWLSEGRSVNDLRQTLERRNLRCIGGFEAGVNCFGSPDEKAQNHALHLENARLIHDLGGGTLVVGTDGPAQASENAWEKVSEAFLQLARRMEGLDVALALEFNWSPLVRSLKSAVKVVEKTDHPQVGVLFDPAHYYVTPTKLEHLTPETVRWIRHCHFNDMRDKPGDWSDCNGDRVLPGEGILPLREMIERLEAGGYQGYFSLEMFSEDLWSLPVKEAATRSYQSMLSYCEPA